MTQDPDSAPLAGNRQAAGETGVPFAEACRYWFKLGCTSFGGPAGQISMMHTELVERRRWIGERRFMHALNFTMMLPGPEAQQLATYVGWLLHGTAGGIVAGSLFVLPSMLMLMLLAYVYMAWNDVPAVAAILYGVKPAVIAIVAFAAWRIGRRALHHPLLVTIAAAAFLLLFVFDVPFPLLVLAAALAGWLGGRYVPAAFAGPAHHGGPVNDTGPAVVDDHTPLPAHARFRWQTTALTLAIGVGAWLLLEGMLAWIFGWEAPLTQLAWFFTKAALVTFGGAYAVLPYVYQGMVEHYGWITGPQMIDALALGETTPGPLVMVNAFVGFVAGWGLGIVAGSPVASAVVAMLLVTFVTFLPSFVFVLVGGPAVEATRHRVAFAAPLAGITAAVVGVILSLALFFAWHVLWPAASPAAPFAGRPDLFALALALGALLALWRFRAPVVPVIAACAGAGLARFGLMQLAGG